MTKYIIKRILLMIPIIIGATCIVFTIMFFTPSDPAQSILGADATPQDIAELREKMGLNDPYIVQLGRYLWKLCKLDFGNSYITGLSIASSLKTRVPNTLRLNLTGVLVGVVIGIPLGVMAAVNRGKVGDYVCMFVALFGVSMPGFWFAMVLVSFFSVNLQLLPPFFVPGLGWRNWVLPIMASCLSCMASLARQSRSSMLDVLYSDYIVTARSKGLPENEVVWKHAFPNAMIPIITVLGNTLGRSLGGGLVIETVFAIPGVGYFIAEAVNQRDYITVEGCVVVIAMVFTVMMLITDLSLALVDPRIKAQFASGGKRR